MKSLIIFVLIGLTLAPSVQALECYAITRVAKSNSDESDAPAHACMKSPRDSIQVTENPSLVGLKDGLNSLVELCTIFCEGRDPSCVGYIISSSCIDVAAFESLQGVNVGPGGPKPSELFRGLGVENWKEEVDEKEADCICLREDDVKQEVVLEYAVLKHNLKQLGSNDVFAALNLMVVFWSNLVARYARGSDAQ